MCFGEQATCVDSYKTIAASSPTYLLVSVTAEDLSDCMVASSQIFLEGKRFNKKKPHGLEISL